MWKLSAPLFTGQPKNLVRNPVLECCLQYGQCSMTEAKFIFCYSTYSVFPLYPSPPLLNRH